LEFQQVLSAWTFECLLFSLAGMPIFRYGLKFGAIEFLTKPLRGQEFLDAVQAAIECDRSRRREDVITNELRERYDSLTTREREIMSRVIAGPTSRSGFKWV
jgi:FixJ family two-component response regulator